MLVCCLMLLYGFGLRVYTLLLCSLCCLLVCGLLLFCFSVDCGFAVCLSLLVYYVCGLLVSEIYAADCGVC